MSAQATCAAATRLAALTAGSPDNPVHATAVVGGDGPLTPALARSLARSTFGHSSGVTVTLGDRAYRLTARSTRRVRVQD